MSTRWVYGFDELDFASERCGNDWDEVRGLLGGKGANLADMTRLGVSGCLKAWVTNSKPRLKP
jgi:pyruvate,orthophosphate dikinase